VYHAASLTVRLAGGGDAEVGRVEDGRAGEVAGILGLVPPRDGLGVATLGLQHVLEDVQVVAVPRQELAHHVNGVDHLLVDPDEVLIAIPRAGVAAGRGPVHQALDGVDEAGLLRGRELAPLGPDAQVGARRAGGGLRAEDQRLALGGVVGNLDLVEGITVVDHAEAHALASEDAGVLLDRGGHGGGRHGHGAAEGGLERETHFELEFLFDVVILSLPSSSSLVLWGGVRRAGGVRVEPTSFLIASPAAVPLTLYSWGWGCEDGPRRSVQRRRRPPPSFAQERGVVSHPCRHGPYQGVSLDWRQGVCHVCEPPHFK